VPLITDDEKWMRVCLELAHTAASQEEIPVGAIVVLDGEIIGRGYNTREQTGDPTAHAEVIAMREASRVLEHWRLIDATLYVTLEPCFMCAGALVNARVKRLVYGCTDPKAGAVTSLASVATDTRLNHRLEVTGGILSQECASVLQEFFRARRRRKKV